MALAAGETAAVGPALCRDCGSDPGAAPLCAVCGSRRLVRHPELLTLGIAHVDCDAFFASVEKRDRPELAGRPVIVGGRVRGVVAAACYVARLTGVRSAMPMAEALRRCPDATVIRPDFAKYSAVAREVRALMKGLTPLVQVLSVDEAVLDLRGTSRLHGAPPAVVLARFARDVEVLLGITVSVGLAPNRLLAKIAAGRDKPRGFAVLGHDAADVLAGETVRLLPGIGPVQARKLAGLGITRLAELQALDDRAALARLGRDGPALARRARGEDGRAVTPGRDAKQVSAETTFDEDIADRAELQRHLRRLADRVARRLREQDLAAGGVVLKLKTARFSLRTRAARLPSPTALPDAMYEAACALLAREVDGTWFRLIGVGAHPLVPGDLADRGDLADPGAPRRAAAQRAVDSLRKRFGDDVIRRG